MRKAAVKRKTKETDALRSKSILMARVARRSRPALAFSTICSILLARHSRIDITVKAKGDPAHRPSPYH